MSTAPSFKSDIHAHTIFLLSVIAINFIFVFAKEVATKIRKVFPCKKVGITVIGLEVPHAHIHLIPINSIDDMNFSKTKLSFSPSEMTALQNLILSVS
jgi:histidine triad (HIT) family protein